MSKFAKVTWAIYDLKGNFPNFSFDNFSNFGDMQTLGALACYGVASCFGRGVPGYANWYVTPPRVVLAGGCTRVR